MASEMRAKKLHTMNPQVAEVVRRMGFVEIFEKLKQLDEAAALVEEGKLKREVYDELVRNVEASLEKQKRSAKKKDGGVFAELLRTLRPAKEDETGSPGGGGAAASGKAAATAGQKPIVEGFLYKRSTRERLFAHQWKKRYCQLYPRALVIYRRKGDTKPHGSIILTPEFFVSQVRGGGSAAQADDDESDGPGARLGLEDIEDESLADDASVGKGSRARQVRAAVAASQAGGSAQQGRGEPEFMFVLSDLNTKYQFATKTLKDLQYWTHILMSVLRKIIDEESYFDTPQLLGAPVRAPDQIQRDYEQRKEAYARSQRTKTLEKTKRKSWFKKNGKKAMTEDDWAQEEAKWEVEGHENARDAVTAQLLEQEREHVRQLEEDQRARERELQEMRALADEMRAEAASNKVKMHEAQQRATKAEEEERRLQQQLELMERMRAQNVEREEAIKLERETTRTQLDAMEDRRRGSRHPEAAREYEAVIKGLQAKLAALQSALDVDLDSLDWDGSLSMAEQKMKDCVPRMMSEDPTESQKAAEEFDQWDKLVRNHADYKKREHDKWATWEQEEGPKNEQAYKLMCSIVPPEVVTGISEAFLVDRGLRPAAAKRVMQTKILQFLYMDKDAIAKLHIADLSSRYIPQGLDIVELRAVYTRLPSEFQNDRDGRKKTWLEQYRAKLFQMTEKEKTNSLSRAEERHPVYRDPKDRGGGGGGPAAPVALGGKGKGKAPAKGKKGKAGKKPAVAKKVNTKALEGLFGAGGPQQKAPGAGPPGVGGPPPHVLAMMQRGAEASEGGDAGSGAAASASSAAKPAPAAAGRPAAASSAADAQQRRPSLKQQGSGFFGAVKSLFSGGSGDASAGAAASATEEAGAAGAAAAAAAAAEAPSNARGGRRSMTEKERLLAAGVRGMMDEQRERNKVEVDGFDEKTAPAFDFGADYGSGKGRAASGDGDGRGSRKETLSRQRAGDFSKGVERGIDKLCQFIRKNGKYDPAEGGLATMSFGELFEKYQLSDMLVGLLMRAKKRKRLKYHGDMLFQGIHDQVKITLLVE